MTHSLYLSANIRDIETSAQKSLPAFTLMHRAGNVIATYIAAHIPAHATLLFLAGPGNNGGDALEAAALLAHQYRVIVLYDNPPIMSDDARQAWQHACEAPITFVAYQQSECILDMHIDAVIDGLFGIGLKRPVSGIFFDIIEHINHKLSCPVIAIDVPSGLDADTGNIVSTEQSHGTAIKASVTLTFIGNKPGLHTADGVDLAGHVILDRLDIPKQLFPISPYLLVNQQALQPHFSQRLANTHKGSFGDVIVIGGDMAGAAILSARSALHAGAGRVFVSFNKPPLAYDPVQPELMIRDRHLSHEHAVIVAGPGLGSSDASAQLLSDLLELPNTMVLDADALNLIANNPSLQHQFLHKKPSPVLMTPHPLEAARLLQISVKDIQANRLQSAQKLAETFNAHVILKGAGTVISSPNAYCSVNTSGNPGLATAGTGDVLSGLCGALLAQRHSVELTSLAAPWIHGHAADLLVKEGIGPVGMTASELFPAIRKTINLLNT